MLILNAEEIRRALPMDQTIDAMKEAFASLSSGIAVVPLRTRLPMALYLSRAVPPALNDLDRVSEKLENLLTR